jgi:hypothetical protein
VRFVAGVERDALALLVERSNHPDPRIFWDASFSFVLDGDDGYLAAVTGRPGRGANTVELLNLVTYGKTPRQRFRHLRELAEGIRRFFRGHDIVQTYLVTRTDRPWYHMLERVLPPLGFTPSIKDGLAVWTLSI